MNGLIAVIVAYLVGGIPFGLLIVRLKTGADVRNSGSGNIGATNVLRTTGPLAGIFTLLLDAAKGLFAARLGDTPPRRAPPPRVLPISEIQRRQGRRQFSRRIRLSHAGSGSGDHRHFSDSHP